MNEYKFQSVLADRLDAFVRLKRLSGTPYTTQSLILKYFDQFLVKEKFTEPYLTREICDRYVATLTHLSARYRSNQCSLVRQFSIYLSRFESRCYVREPVPAGKSQDEWRAFIFSEQLIRNLLAAAGRISVGHWLRPHTYRTLIGLLYTTGIRIGEALALNVGDFYPDTLRLYIHAGKFRKSRWVPVSVSTGKALADYVELREQIVSKDTGPPLFISQKYTRLHEATVYQAFCKLLAECSIKKTRKHGPRIHDLRHTFAVHRLLGWYRDGQDINARLPALGDIHGTCMGLLHAGLHTGNTGTPRMRERTVPELCAHK